MRMRIWHHHAHVHVHLRRTCACAWRQVLLWIGVSRIDKFVSNSTDKACAVKAAGIEIVDTIDLPERFVPRAGSFTCMRMHTCT